MTVICNLLLKKVFVREWSILYNFKGKYILYYTTLDQMRSRVPQTHFSEAVEPQRRNHFIESKKCLRNIQL